MEPTSESSSRVPKRDRPITADWFQCPPTDYLNVSSLTYPRGLRSTVAEIDENNALVEVLRRKGDEGPFVNSGQRKVGAIITLYLETDIDNLRDASTSNVKFLKLNVKSKQLLDAIQPALASVHYRFSDFVTEECNFPSPLDGLFFAQGRIIEIMKHGNMGPIKSKQLRALVTAMRVAMERLNEQLREMAVKKIVDFKHIWTIFPVGSFAVFEDRKTTHIVQIDSNPIEPVTTKKPEEGGLFFGLTSYGFDGYNIGAYSDTWQVKCFDNHVSVASLKYRPLKFEERVNPSVIKDAVEIGRKALDYQSHHYCHYSGPAYPASTKDGAFETKVRVRVPEVRAA